ncbi:MAG: hypothetical protein LBJ69_03165, partial [Holosporales bacterium]|nr:hypothetical protein [Holosporales bacterium]
MSTILFPKLAFRAIGIIAWPVVIIYSYIRVLVGLGDRRRRSETFGIPSVARPAGRLVWLHAVSVGEVLSVIPFILKLRSIDKAATILVTTTTLTSAKIVKERLGDSVI